MSKLIYMQGDDQKLLEKLLQFLRSNGYSVQYGNVLDERQLPVHFKTDIVLCCSPERSKEEDSPILTFGNLRLDPHNFYASTAGGEELHLTPTEFSMLSYLMQSNRAVSRNELIPAIWGFENQNGTRVADDTVKRLRRKLKGTGVMVETVWGYGFKLVTES